MKNIYIGLIELIEKGKHNEAIVLNYLMLKSIKGNNQIINKKTGVVINSGEYQISLRELSKKTNITFQTLRTSINNLKKINVLDFTVKNGVYVFVVIANTDNSLNHNLSQGLPTQQNERSTQQIEKINTESNTDNSLNDSVSQGFPTQQSTQQIEKINTALINKDFYQELKKTSASASEVHSIGYKEENFSDEKQNKIFEQLRQFKLNSFRNEILIQKIKNGEIKTQEDLIEEVTKMFNN